MLDVRLLGTFAVHCDGNPVTISSRTAQSLFAYLILTAGTPHRREKLAGMFWPETSEGKSRAYLRHELWRIRKALASSSTYEYIIADDISIAFNPAAEYWLDAHIVKKLSDTTTAAEFITALSNGQGEFLPGFYEEWAVQEREHLSLVYEQKITRLLELLEREKRWHEMLEWSERWISLNQSSEDAFYALMVAYDALGNRPRVVSTYERCVQALRAIDVQPSEKIRALTFRPTSRWNILLPLTSFVGRQNELKEVARLLTESRLVTLTGSGGVGKTRLSIQVAAEVLERFQDGVWFLDLAPLSDPALVANTLANLVGLRETGSARFSVTDLLIDYFRTRTALAIFDNCEHLIESCAQLVNSLLISCPNLTILATSREALRVSGEIPYRVPSLALPESDAEPDLDGLSNMESVKLFTERAAVASRGFKFDSSNARAVVQICRRLDGIPLALELAAARVGMLAIDQIVQRLDRSFDLLTGGLRSSLPRHQTLRATIEWSYNLLSDKENLLFRRLAVFGGGWTLEAAEKVCGGQRVKSTEVLDLLSQLVNKSLVLVEVKEGGPRYRTLETIRQFSREKLFATDQAEALRERHLDYFLKKAEEIEPFLTGAEQSAWMEYLDLELDNNRLALEWSISNQQGEEALRLFGALGWFWFIRCHFREGRQWFREALRLREGVSRAVQAKALMHAAQVYWVDGDLLAAENFNKESLGLYRELGDLKGISSVLLSLGVTESGLGKFAEAQRLFEESLSVSRMANNMPFVARALFNLGGAAWRDGDTLTAWQRYEEGLAICREVQDSHLTTVVLQDIGDMALAQENYPKARECYEEVLTVCLKLKDTRNIAYALLHFADLLCAEARYVQSAQLLGYAVTMFQQSGALPFIGLPEIERTSGILKTFIDADTYEKQFEAGKRLQLEQVIEITLHPSA